MAREGTRVLLMGTPSALQHYHPPTTTTQRVLLATGVAQGFGRRTWREAQAVQPTQPGGKAPHGAAGTGTTHNMLLRAAHVRRTYHKSRVGHTDGGGG